VFNLIGAEIKALPVAMKVLGLVLEFVFIISMGISAKLLVGLSVLCKAVVYNEVVQYAMGRPARLLSENCLIVNNVGVTVVYLIVLRDVMSGSVYHVEVSDQWLGNEDWSQLMILVVLVLFLVPLCAFKRIYSLSVTYVASVALIVVFDKNEEGLEEKMIRSMETDVAGLVKRLMQLMDFGFAMKEFSMLLLQLIWVFLCVFCGISWPLP